MTRLASLLAAAAFVATPIAARAAPAASDEGAVAIAPIAFTERTLANGLRVYAIRDTNSPNVSVQVWYDVGSKDDPRGRSGFAHLFEHLMFKGTRNMVPEQMDRLIEDVGGTNNASTWDDFTNYHETIPANHLQRLLWAEAERMGSLVVDDVNFRAERDVVKEELRSGLARPYGKLFAHYLPTASYSVHPYARPGIGSIEDLDAATIDDVRAFHATYYRPDNAVLVVSGNFDPGQLDRWVDDYFGPIRRPSQPIPRVTFEEPPRTAARSFTLSEPNTPLPAVVLTYLLPPAGSPDDAALDLLEAILTRGDNSRLEHALVRSRIASEAGAFSERKQSTGLLAVYAILAAERTVDDAETVLRRELARLAREPVTPAELTEAKNELLTAALSERQTVDGRAAALARGVIVQRDPRAADTRLERLQTVSAADIQRVAASVLADRASVVIRTLPVPSGAARGDRIALAPSVTTRLLGKPADMTVFQPASDAERIAPPPPAAPIAITTPRIATARLANGLTVITVPRPGVPLVSANLLVNSGAAADPAGKAGLHSLTAKLMTKGTATRSATQVAEAIEALGTSLHTGAGREAMALNLSVKVDQLPAALSVLADVAQNSTYRSSELELARGQAIDEATIALQDPGSVAGLAVTRAVFGTGAYGSAAGGTPQSLRAISHQDILAAAGRGIRPENSVLVLSGDIDPASARGLAETALGQWASAPGAKPLPQPAASALAPLRGKIILIDMPGAAQAAVAIAKATGPRSSPDYYPSLIANDVLGGGYSSRLNREIRIKRGLSYGAGSSLSSERSSGTLAISVQTKNESAPEVLNIILAEMKRIGAEPIPAEELGARQANMIGGFGRELESVSGLGGLVSGLVQQGVEPGELGRFVERVRAVAPASASKAAAAKLSPEGATIVIVGDTKVFAQTIRKQFGDVTLIPVDRLKLDSAALQ